MKRRTTLILIIVFVVFIGVAAYAYPALSGKVKPEDNFGVSVQESDRGQSGSAQPSVGQSGSAQPDSGQAGAAQSGGDQPASAQPSADQPVPAQPAPSETDAAQSSEKAKTKAPDFTVVDANGEETKLSDMLGAPVVLNFWASWCPPCKSEMPEFDKVNGDLGDKVRFMMVDLTDGQRETMATGAKYISDQGYTFPVYFDTEQSAAYAYGIQAIPTTVFIDKDGYIVTVAQGAIDENTLRKGIEMIAP